MTENLYLFNAPIINNKRKKISGNNLISNPSNSLAPLYYPSISCTLREPQREREREREREEGSCTHTLSLLSYHSPLIHEDQEEASPPPLPSSNPKFLTKYYYKRGERKERVAPRWGSKCSSSSTWLEEH